MQTLQSRKESYSSSSEVKKLNKIKTTIEDALHEHDRDEVRKMLEQYENSNSDDSFITLIKEDINDSKNKSDNKEK